MCALSCAPFADTKKPAATGKDAKPAAASKAAPAKGAGTSAGSLCDYLSLAACFAAKPAAATTAATKGKAVASAKAARIGTRVRQTRVHTKVLLACGIGSRV